MNLEYKAIDPQDLSRLSAILSGEFVAHGLVVDDRSQGLYRSVETFAKDHGMPISFRHMTSSADPGKPLEAAQNADVVVVDHRLDKKFEGYNDGLAVASALRKLDERQPLFYCSGYSPDFLKQSRDGSPTFTRRATCLGSDPFTFLFDKDDLVKEKRLREFSQMIYWQAIGYTLHRIKGSVPSEVFSLIAAKPLRRENSLFRVLGPAGRGWMSIQKIDRSELTEEELIPSRLLKFAGIGRGCSVVSHSILEFDNGCVLSSFSPGKLEGENLPDAVINILRDSDDD